MSSTHEKRPSASGSLQERPVARLLQQLFRKQITGHLCITDQTGDESDVYLREGMPVHVHRPVDTDRLDRVLVEFGVVSEDAVARAAPMVAEGMRLGEALERMGVLSKDKLAEVLKQQMRRKLTRLFCVADGGFAIYLKAHGFGEGDDLAAMRVDPRTLFFPAIRAAYDLPRVTRELSRLWGQEFRLASVSASFVSAMGIPTDDHIVAALRARWLTLDEIDSVTARPLEVRTILLSLYYADLLERQKLGARPAHHDPLAATTPRHAPSTIPSSTQGSPAAVAAPPAQPATPVVPAPAAAAARPRPSAPIPVVAAPAAAASPATPSAPIPVVAAPAAMAPTAAARPVVPAPSPEAAAAPRAPAALARPSQSPEGAARVVGARATGSSIKAVPAPDATLRTAVVELAEKLDSLSHFQLLDVCESATAGEVSAAFIRAARRFHPDRLAGAGLSDLVPQAERILARLSEAAMVLGDAAGRAEYVDARAGKKPLSSTVPTVIEAETTFLKGEVLLKRGDHAKAIECFAAACKANPGEPQYRAYLAWARFENPQGRKEAVVREVQRSIADVVAAQPRFARGHYWLGQIWKFLNEPDRAEAAFREAAHQDKDFIEAEREMRVLEMRRTKAHATRKKTEPPQGGIVGRLFKK
jgi:curved DNA-binding protein CbpA